MTTTWYKPTNPPDADVCVLIARSFGDGSAGSCEGYFGCNPDGREFWYTVGGQPIEHEYVFAWADMPVCEVAP